MRIGGLMLFLALAGCVGAPAKPYYTEDVLVVGKDWSKYWAFNWAWMSKMGPPPKYGCFYYEVIIDSNGDPFGGKLLALEGLQADWVTKLVALQRFRPTDANPNRTPVKAILEFTFFPDPQDPYRHKRRPPGDYTPSAEYDALADKCIALLDKQGPSLPIEAPAAATKR
jgi:hypothetical protein